MLTSDTGKIRCVDECKACAPLQLGMSVTQSRERLPPSVMREHQGAFGNPFVLDEQCPGISVGSEHQLANRRAGWWAGTVGRRDGADQGHGVFIEATVFAGPARAARRELPAVPPMGGEFQ
jgi:hypothetical protein